MSECLRKAKGGMINFGSWFQRFKSMVTWPHCSRPYGKAEYHGRKYTVEQSCSHHSSQEAEGEEKS
jgi:hypothetical protein